jgi:hypothetical protein
LDSKNTCLKKFLEFVEVDSNSNRLISIADVLLADLGRIISGKLKIKKHNLWNLSVLYLRKLIHFFNLLKNIKIIYFARQKEFVLIHLTEQNHLSQLIPIFNELNKNIDVKFFTTKLSVLKKLRLMNLPILELNFFIFKHKIQPIKWSFKREFELLKAEGILTSEIKNYYFICLADLIIQNFFYKFNLDTKNIKAILIGNDLTQEGRLLASIAKREGIKTYSIQHGYLAQDWLQKYHICNYFFVFGLASKIRLDSQTNGKILAIISGAPYLEENGIEIIKKMDSTKIIKNYLKIKNGYVLVCLSGYGHLTSRDHYYQILELLQKSFSHSKDLHFVVKLHPKEQISDYECARISEMNNVTCIKHQVNEELGLNIFDWLENSIGLITGNSSTSFEALYLDKPVICLDINNEYTDFEFKKYKAAPYLANAIDLNMALSQINDINDNYRDTRFKLKTDYFYQNKDQLASTIISNFLLNYNN